MPGELPEPEQIDSSQLWDTLAAGAAMEGPAEWFPRFWRDAGAVLHAGMTADSYVLIIAGMPSGTFFQLGSRLVPPSAEAERAAELDLLEHLAEVLRTQPGRRVPPAFEVGDE